MYQNKKILAIIPARSGSKGLSNKNILTFNGLPLMAYAIKNATESNIIDYTFLSTDSDEYAEIGHNYGAEIPFLRPNDISQDDSSSTDFILYTLENLEKLGEFFDYFILLQPTPPLRNYLDVRNSLKMIIDEQLMSGISVCEAEHPLEYYNTLKKDLSMEHFISVNCTRQALAKSYRLNGAIYISNCDYYK